MDVYVIVIAPDPESDYVHVHDHVHEEHRTCREHAAFRSARWPPRGGSPKLGDGKPHGRTRRQRLALAAGLALALAHGACAREGERPVTERRPELAVEDPALAGWRGAGLRVEPFAATDPAAWGASGCQRGRVEGLDALLCRYRDDLGLAEGRRRIEAEWERSSVPTGVAARSGHTLLALSDPTRRDAGGRAARRVVQAFAR